MLAKLLHQIIDKLPHHTDAERADMHAQVEPAVTGQPAPATDGQAPAEPAAPAS